jgi:large subunit ribosomal protein L25
VLYGHGNDPIAISVDAKELRQVFSHGHGANAFLSLNIDGKKHSALAKTVQHHKVRQVISHIDFQLVNRNEVISVDVPLEFVGDPVNVTRYHGTVEHLASSVSLKSTPEKIPNAITVDISHMNVDQILSAADLVIPKGVELDTDPGFQIAIAHAGRGVATESSEDDNSASS